MGHGLCSSFEARKSAHLRMTGHSAQSAANPLDELVPPQIG
jgi:hypothetical protein